MTVRMGMALAILLTFAAAASTTGTARAGSTAPLVVPSLASDAIDIGPYNIPDANGSPGPTLGLAGTSSVDPLGLVPYPDEVRRYSLGHDVFEVWSCPDPTWGSVPITVGDFVVEAEARMTEHFLWLSGGRYDPDFIVGGVVPTSQSETVGCAAYARQHATGSADGALFIRNEPGGMATPGFWCVASSSCPTSYPANAREGYVGVSPTSWSTVAHEMGHMLSWPHSFTGATDSQYDNAIDLMSGNSGTWKVGGVTYWGQDPDPYGTAAINRYRAGWIDRSSVVVWDGTDTSVMLGAIGSAGVQALVIEDGDRFFTLGTRISSAHDPFPSAWNGVEVYKTIRCSTCWSLNAVVRPEPPVPFIASPTAYEDGLDHVLGVGESHDICGTRLTVTSGTTSSFTVHIDPIGVTGFIDVCGSDTFAAEIQWLAGEGITKGCNPPANDKYCPDAFVSREQMAAFLVRAFGYSDAGSGDLFTDDDTSIFEADIDKLATAGVTKGCNPPTNTAFCGPNKVTREQMAAFLVRALGYSDAGSGDLFTDDDTSIFEADIDKLATAGVTKGCNPPTNTKYCPTQFVTRAQMAAFLYRALH